MAFNSTELLEFMKRMEHDAGDNLPIDLAKLAEQFEITIPKMISVLTELENRDQVILEVTTSTDNISGELAYEGSVRLMEHPPDELRDPNNSNE